MSRIGGIKEHVANAFSCRNDSAPAEQRTNQGDLKLRSVGIHRLYAVMIDE
jgi:hypothetical protein